MGGVPRYGVRINRLGDGEGYLDTFIAWIHQQGEIAATKYFQQNSPPNEWQEFCDYHLQLMKIGKGPWEY